VALGRTQTVDHLRPDAHHTARIARRRIYHNILLNSMELPQAEVISQEDEYFEGKDVPEALIEVQKLCRSNPVNRRSY
jgi:hypothetical protein